MSTTSAAPAAPSTAVIRGGLWLMAAKLLHTVAGFGLWFFLAAAFGHALGAVAGTAALGVYGTTMAIVNPLNMMFAQGTLQVVSHLVATHGEDMGAVFRRCLRVQVPLVLGFLLLYELSAPLVAEHVLGDPGYTTILRLGGAIPVFYALRCLYQGYCNGTRRFAAQSAIDMGSSVLRMVLVLGGAALGWGAMGAVGGFVAASAVMMVIAVVAIRPGVTGSAVDVPARRILGFQWKILATTLVMYGLMSTDGILVKRLAALDPADADRYAGYFTGVLKIAQIPWGIITALAWVMFPLFSERARHGGREEVAGLLSQGLRTALLLIVPVAVVLCGSAHETYALVWPKQIRSMQELGDARWVVSQPLVVHALGYGVYGLLVIAAMLITAGGRPGVSLALLSATLVVSVGLGLVLTPRMGPMGAALANTVAWTAGLAAAALALRRRYGAFVHPGSTVRILACGAVAGLLAWTVPASGLLLLIEDAAVLVVFAGLLIASREVTWHELKGIGLAVAGRRAS